MSGFYTKERNDNGEYEITFYTENLQDFEKVQDLCRKLIGHGKPVSNEGDLISRKALKEEINKRLIYGENGNDNSNDVQFTYAKVRKLIDNAPTVAVNCEDCDGYEAGYSAGVHDTERPQGEWIEVDVHGEPWYKCSNCGFTSYPVENYCPDCGADMRGEDTNETS